MSLNILGETKHGALALMNWSGSDVYGRLILVRRLDWLRIPHAGVSRSEVLKLSGINDRDEVIIVK